MRLLRIFLAVLLTCFASTAAFSQAETGAISGTVRDATGAVIPDSVVVATDMAKSTARTVQTNSLGGYSISGLAPGTYRVAVTKSGFATYSVMAQVTVAGHSTVDPILTVSESLATVEVIAGAGTEINTQSQEVSQVISPEQVTNLPSLTRNIYDFVALAGNVSGGDRGMSNGNPQLNGAGQNGFDRGVGFSLNGQRASGTEILLDGAENSNIFDTSIALLVPQDAVREFRVITNNFDAQYGRASGGVINVVTKSGGNAFHGDAWEFNRLSAYTANTFDNSVNGVPKGTYTRNQFGYDVGGPIAKDKLFFYQSTEWLRVRSNASVLAYVPTPQLLAQTPANVQSYFNTYGNQSFNFISTVAASDLGSTPGGTFATTVPGNTPAFGLVNYNSPVDAGGDVPQNTYELIGRVDYNFTPKTQMFFRFGRESLLALPGSISSSPYPQYNVGQTIYNNNYLLSVNHIFNDHLVSSTKLSFFRDTEAYQYNQALQLAPTLFLYNNANVNGQPLQLPGFFDSTTGSGGLPYGGPQNTVQINQDISWSKGTHTTLFGGQVNYIQLNRGFGAYAQAIEQLGANRAESAN